MSNYLLIQKICLNLACKVARLQGCQNFLRDFLELSPLLCNFALETYL